MANQAASLASTRCPTRRTGTGGPATSWTWAATTTANTAPPGRQG